MLCNRLTTVLNNVLFHYNTTRSLYVTPANSGIGKTMKKILVGNKRKYILK